MARTSRDFNRLSYRAGLRYTTARGVEVELGIEPLTDTVTRLRIDVGSS